MKSPAARLNENIQDSHRKFGVRPHQFRRTSPKVAVTTVDANCRDFSASLSHRHSS